MISENKLRFAYLADNPSVLPVIAQWYFNEWGYLKSGASAESFARELQPYLSGAGIPLAVLAKQGGDVVGVAQLKFHEMDIYPQYEYWLGGVYVSPEYRGRNIASFLVKEMINEARRFDVETLYLQTQNMTGGLYAGLGWEPLEKIVYRGVDTLVMQNKLV